MPSSTITPLINQRLKDAHSEALPLDSRQKRFFGRSVIIPTLDWSQYRLSAGFDTIVVKCHFTIKSRHPALRKTLEKSLRRKVGYIFHLDPEETGQSCLITIQQPSIGDLKALEALPFVQGRIELQQVEIAIDFKPSRKMKDEARTEACKAAVETLARYVAVDPIWSPHGCNPRWTIGSPDKNSDKTFTTTGRQAFHECSCVYSPAHLKGTFNLTHVKQPIEYRIYHKTKDGIGGSDERDLPGHDQIARHEFILYRRALKHFGLTNIHDLQSFQFETLSTFAQFRAPTVKQHANDSSPLSLAASQRFTALRLMRFLNGGMTIIEDGSYKPRDGKWGQTVALSDLNKRTGMALVRLTDKVKNGGGASSV